MRVSNIPLRSFRWIKKKYWQFVFDENTISNEEIDKLDSLGFGKDRALVNLNDILLETIGRKFDYKTDSIHWLLWSIVALKKPIRRVLEIGTFKGEGANLLARLFPQAEIITVDLPEDDPLLRNSYKRDTEEEYQLYIKEQEKNTQLPNIKRMKINSFFVPSVVKGSFDLIWIDGGHLFPEVAWDICNAWNLCEPGGFILCDDVVILDGEFKNEYVSTESYKVIKYLNDRTALRTTFFLKRRNPASYASLLSRKYVALIEKPEQMESPNRKRT